MFQRYVDIIVKQAIYEAEKRAAELTATGIDSLLDDIHKRVYAEASDSLKDFLFDEKFGRTDSWRVAPSPGLYGGEQSRGERGRLVRLVSVPQGDRGENPQTIHRSR